MEVLKRVIPEELLQSPAAGTPWETHKGYGSWNQAGEDSWLCMEIMDKIFGKQNSMEAYVAKSNWLQCEGLKCIFEESRRQKPACSMAINWCFNEPWNNVAGPVIVSWPCEPKPGYYAVQDALRPVMPSAAIPSFTWEAGSLFRAEIWLLNDTPSEVSDTVRVYLECAGEKQLLLSWDTGILPPGENKRGHVVQAILPQVEAQCPIFLTLEAESGVSRYALLLKPGKKKSDGHELNA
jgi:beta-mannosidase